MRGHFTSQTRRLNRHYQNDKGGYVPPAPTMVWGNRNVGGLWLQGYGEEIKDLIFTGGYTPVYNLTEGYLLIEFVPSRLAEGESFTLLDNMYLVDYPHQLVIPADDNEYISLTGTNTYEVYNNGKHVTIEWLTPLSYKMYSTDWNEPWAFFWDTHVRATTVLWGGLMGEMVVDIIASYWK